MNQEQYNELYNIVLKVTKNSPNARDLFHDVLVQLQCNQTYIVLPYKEQKYFFVKVLRNQFYSKNSLYVRTYKRQEHDDLPTTYTEIPDEEYEQEINIEWVNNQLDQLHWYKRDLFKLYMLTPNLYKLSKKTQIPLYSVRFTINEVRKILKDKRLNN